MPRRNRIGFLLLFSLQFHYYTRDELDSTLAEDALAATSMPPLFASSVRQKGVAIIISMKEGSVGSDTDRRRLVDMADYMKFRPVAIVDPTAEELGNMIQEVLRKEVDNEDECILCYSQITVVPEPDQIMPEAEDCLLMYSCCPGEENWIRPTGYEKGSLFADEVTNQVKWLYQTTDVHTDVQDIFAEVKRRVQESAARLEKEQVPQIHSSLSKRLSWRPR
ncbi:hypothetical protein R1sor_014663 [Riccia sorocarpa]|uniref:Peptidase C14 caspase domain-containing protein n=1 Tax=Riccia sorocarpa TaxID=122646 RepID=A0ABD3HG56_9MARC